MKKLLVILLILLSFTDSFAAYSYKRTETSNNALAGVADTSNFPALIYISNADFKTVANGGKIQNANGYDIAFFSDSALTTQLSWEIESYDGTNGVLWAWVKIPTLTVATANVIYVGYGDASISTFQSTGSVWDTNYKGVYHLPNGTSLTANDSTTNAVNSTSISGTAVAGKIGPGAAAFNGSTQFIGFGDAHNITGTNITIEGWMYRTGTGNYFSLVSRNGTGGPAIPLQYQVSHLISGGATGDKFRFDFVDTGGTLRTTDSTNAFAATAVWRHIVVTYNGTNAIIYVNGTADITAARTESITTSVTGAQFRMATDTPRGADYGIGRLDEVRISNTSRSASYVTASYNNQNDPAAFWTLGAEQSATSTATARKGHNCLFGSRKGLCRIRY